MSSAQRAKGAAAAAKISEIVSPPSWWSTALEDLGASFIAPAVSAAGMYAWQAYRGAPPATAAVAAGLAGGAHYGVQLLSDYAIPAMIPGEGAGDRFSQLALEPFMVPAVYIAADALVNTGKMMTADGLRQRLMADGLALASITALPGQMAKTWITGKL